MSPAFEPGSYFQNAVENSISTKGMWILDETISKSDKKPQTFCGMTSVEIKGKPNALYFLTDTVLL